MKSVDVDQRRRDSDVGYRDEMALCVLRERSVLVLLQEVAVGKLTRPERGSSGLELREP